MRKSILLIGPGSTDGLGMEISKLFGSRGFKILTLSRNINKLEDFKETLGKDSIENEYWIADCRDTETVDSVINKMIQNHNIELIIFNVSSRKSDSILDISSKNLIDSLEINSTSLLNFIRPLLDHLQANKGAIITTGGGLGIKPDWQKASLSLDKATLRLITLLLAEQLYTKEIFVGTITISATIKNDSPSDPRKIAKLYEQMFLKREKNELIFSI
ncbi:SDR family NAD(P)-dependent oxidoreductase [Enterococcus faecalis]